MGIKICCFRCCFVSWVLIGVGIMVISGFFLEGLIQQQAAEGVKMTADTYGLWGIIPGDTQTYTVRNFTMFNFTNAREFLYKRGTQPKFVEVGGFLYQEKSQFLRYNYSDRQEFVDYDYWLYFEQLSNSRDVHEKLNVINVGPLGFWMQLDTASLSAFAIQGLGGLFVEMNATIKAQAIGQGISSTFLPTFENFCGLAAGIGIPKRQIDILWNDTEFGLLDQNHYLPWVQAAYYNDQVAKEGLFRHFYPIHPRLLQGLMKEIRDYAESIDNIVSHYYCGGEVCSSFDLTIKQLATAGVTSDPPPGSPPAPSICSTNSTCVGSPEIPTFLHNEFKKIFPDEKYQKLTFSEEWLAPLMTPYQKLLNIGFLNTVFTLGEAYDANPQEKQLVELQELIQADSLDHTFVFWQWLKYFTQEFVLKQDRSGSRKIAGLGGVFSQAIYQASYAFAAWYLRDAYSFLASQEIGENCLPIMTSFLSSQQSEQICSQLSPNSTDYTQYYSIVEPCLDSAKFYSFAAKFGIKDVQMELYCDMDDEPSHIGQLALKISAALNRHHNCSETFSNDHCTEKDLIIKQIFSSAITLNPYPGYGHSPSKIAHDWQSEVPVFEYQAYLEVSEQNDEQVHTAADVQDLFSFDKLLNGPAVQELFIEKNDTAFRQKYHWQQPCLLRNYIRFVVIEVGFGGLTQSRSAEEIFFGYEDPFLKQLRDTDTLAGGDPSISPNIAFNQLNMTKEQSVINKQRMKTGILDPQVYRQFVSLYNKTFIAVNSTYYTGEEVKWEMVSPWAEKVPLQGSDGFAVPPHTAETDKPVVYISSIARFANVSTKNKLEKYGLDLFDMRIDRSALQSQSDNPDNKKYYQTFTGFLNQSYQGFPLFVSKNHFLDADPHWAQRAVIVDTAGHLMTANDWDDTRLYIEPYTGTAFSATVYLQSNFYYVPDVLYPEYEEIINEHVETTQRMLPVVNTFRSGNISEEAVDKYWGDLRTFKKGKRVGVLFGIATCAFTAVVWMAWKIQETEAKKEKNKPSLLEEGDDE